MSWSSLYRKLFYIMVLVLLIVVPVVTQDIYYLGLITLILINILLAASMWLILTTGQVTLGHAGFGAIGAYISAALVLSYGLSSWLAMVVAVAVAGLIAVGIGYITLRIKGIYFMITTLALGLVIPLVFNMFQKPFGGTIGLLNVPSPAKIGSIDFSSQTSLYYLTLVLVLFGVIVMSCLEKSHIGRIFRGISQADNLAEHIGVNIMNYKVLAFMVGSLFAGLAGVLYTYSTSSITPSSFTLSQSTMYLVYTAVGGAATIAGPILGTVVFSLLSEALKPIAIYEPIIYGLILIVVVLTFRSGLLGLWEVLRHRFLGWIGKRKNTPAKKPA